MVSILGYFTGQAVAITGVLDFGVVAIQTAIQTGVVGATAAGFFSAVALPITLGVAGVGLGALSMYNIHKAFKAVVLSSMSE